MKGYITYVIELSWVYYSPLGLRGPKSQSEGVCTPWEHESNLKQRFDSRGNRYLIASPIRRRCPVVFESPLSRSGVRRRSCTGQAQVPHDFPTGKRRPLTIRNPKFEEYLWLNKRCSGSNPGCWDGYWKLSNQSDSSNTIPAAFDDELMKTKSLLWTWKHLELIIIMISIY